MTSPGKKVLGTRSKARILETSISWSVGVPWTIRDALCGAPREIAAAACVMYAWGAREAVQREESKPEYWVCHFPAARLPLSLSLSFPTHKRGVTCIGHDTVSSILSHHGDSNDSDGNSAA